MCRSGCPVALTGATRARTSAAGTIAAAAAPHGRLRVDICQSAVRPLLLGNGDPPGPHERYGVGEDPSHADDEVQVASGGCTRRADLRDGLPRVDVLADEHVDAPRHDVPVPAR